MIPSLCACEALIRDPYFLNTATEGLTTVYVNADHARASDSNDGSRARPFQTLTPVQTITPGMAVVIYPSVTDYTVPTGGFSVVGGGAGAPAIVIGAPGLAKPVINALPYSTVGSGMPATAAQIRVRQVFDVSGSHCRLEHLDVRYGFRSNVIFRGSHMVLRDCHLVGAFEDGIKVVAPFESQRDTDYGLIIGNDVEGFASQGIDMVCAGFWWVTRNTFHDPQLDFTFQTYLANGVGMKAGCPTNILTQNVFYNIPGAPERGCIELGGAGDNFDDATTDCIASDNRIIGYAGPAIAASSAVRAGIYRNQVQNCLLGVIVGLDEDVHTAQPNSDFCQFVHVGENRFAITSGGAMIRVASDTDAVGFLSEGNRYVGDDSFVQRAVPVNWATFKAWLNTDASSHGF